MFCSTNHKAHNFSVPTKPQQQLRPAYCKRQCRKTSYSKARFRPSAVPPVSAQGVTGGHEITDYRSNAGDEVVLQLPPKQQLHTEQTLKVFGYSSGLEARYELRRLLGAGSFGIVREAVDKYTGDKYAVKTVPKIPKKGFSTPRYLLKIRQEVDAMQQLGASLDAVYLSDVYEDNCNVHMVMELCQGGALLDRMKSQTHSEQSIAQIVRCIARFIAQCHAKGVVYRDVKPDNFLFLTKEPDSPIKATDFGLSIKYKKGDPLLKSRSGTPAYMAPEVLMQSYTEKVDVWSVGMLTYQLLTGTFPFWKDIRSCTLQQVWSAILQETIDYNAPDLVNLSENAIDFLKHTLDRDPTRRYSAVQALQHPWLYNIEKVSQLPLAGSVVQRLQRFATYSHLKQLVYNMVINELQVNGSQESVDDLRTLRELFELIDKDNNGQVSFSELQVALKEQGYNLSEQEVGQLMARVDLNRDGEIMFEEFASGLLDWGSVRENEGEWPQWIESAFQKLDQDGDGFISLDELITELPVSYDDDMTDERLVEAKRMLREADTDFDGKISRQEFMQILLDEQGDKEDLTFFDTRLSKVSQGVDEELENLKISL
eukprot:TRINITY_DN10806_c0_g1_i4.p1 TRINITY_DN10806_c0_g1~~TRINITY_DN10806_c0_g1_i4.p1  ORF type:complete len:597 (-),score=64.72 TRINITY_DN10806_c0_g1_i4:571-2361(-)